MALLIGATLAVVSILILAYPFLRARFRAQPDDSTGGAPIGIGGLEAIYQEISTLRLEYQLGKVPEHLYQELLRAYRLQAAVALRQQAQAGEAGLADDSSEQDILAVQQVRLSHGSGKPGRYIRFLVSRFHGKDVAAQVALRSREGVPVRCPHCGAAVGRGDRVCPACNGSQAGSERACPDPPTVNKGNTP